MEVIINFFTLIFSGLMLFLLCSTIAYFVVKWLIKLYLSDWVEMIKLFKLNFWDKK